MMASPLSVTSLPSEAGALLPSSSTREPPLPALPASISTTIKGKMKDGHETLLFLARAVFDMTRMHLKIESNQ